jgi:hypothetical protein
MRAAIQPPCFSAKSLPVRKSGDLAGGLRDAQRHPARRRAPLHRDGIERAGMGDLDRVRIGLALEQGEPHRQRLCWIRARCGRGWMLSSRP